MCCILYLCTLFIWQLWESFISWLILKFYFLPQNFIYKWDRSHSCSVTDVERIRYETSVQLMFKYVLPPLLNFILLKSIWSHSNSHWSFSHCRSQIQEPTEEELLCELRKHPHLELNEWHTDFSPTLIKLWLLQSDFW